VVIVWGLDQVWDKTGHFEGFGLSLGQSVKLIIIESFDYIWYKIATVYLDRV